MLDKFVAAFGALFLIIAITMSCTMLIGMIGQWYALQNTAQYIASSQGKYGGYTEKADQELSRFADDYNLNETVLRRNTSVSSPHGPTPYGEVVTAEITYPFEFELGDFISLGTINLTGHGRAVSTYLDGTYSVNYTAP